MLEHEQALRSQLDTPQEGYMGIINKNTSPYEVSKIAMYFSSNDSSWLVTMLIMSVINSMDMKSLSSLMVVWIEHSLIFQITWDTSSLKSSKTAWELLWNTTSAKTMIFLVLSTSTVSWSLIAIHIIIADGEKNTDVVIKISDQGGGIKRDKIDKIWNYFYTTNKSIHMDLLDQCRDFGVFLPLLFYD